MLVCFSFLLCWFVVFCFLLCCCCGAMYFVCFSLIVFVVCDVLDSFSWFECVSFL